MKRRDERGLASIEFVGAVPVMIAATAILWQLVLVGSAVTGAENAARNASRVAGRGAGDTAVIAVARDSLPGWLDAAAASVDVSGTRVEVDVPLPVLFPGATIEGLSVSRSAEFPVTAGGPPWA